MNKLKATQNLEKSTMNIFFTISNEYFSTESKQQWIFSPNNHNVYENWT